MAMGIGLAAIASASEATWHAEAFGPDEGVMRNQFVAYAWGVSPADMSVLAIDILTYSISIIHFDGSTWATVENSATSDPDILGSGEYRYFGVGQKLYVVDVSGEAESLWLFDGQKWKSIHLEATVLPDDLWVDDTGNIYTVSGHGTISRCNGDKWTTLHQDDSAIFTAIWGTGANNVYAVGLDGLITHYDGQSWETIDLGTDDSLVAISGTASNNIYVVGMNADDQPELFHFDGQLWGQLASEPDKAVHSAYGARPLTVIGTNDVYWQCNDTDYNPCILHYNGSSWTASSLPDELQQIGSVADLTDEGLIVAGVANNGIGLWSYDDSTWSALSLEPIEISFVAGGISLAGDDIWASSVTISGAVLTGSGDMSCVGTLYHWDGTSWSSAKEFQDEAVVSLWGTTEAGLYAIVLSVADDPTKIIHYDGNDWETVVSDAGDCRMLWGSGENDIFAVGEAGAVWHYDGHVWQTQISGTTEDLVAIWGTNSTNVYAVGNAGTIIHYTGQDWGSIESGTTENLSGIWGSSDTDIHVVGANGTAIHYDGNQWAAEVTGVTCSLDAIWGFSNSSVYIAGYNVTSSSPILLHFDGVSWEVMDLPDTLLASQGYAQSLWGCGPSNLYWGGDFGLYRFGPGAAPTGTGTLSIITTPINSEVLVDGESWGLAPQTRDVTVGSHVVSFAAANGYTTPVNQAITVADGESRTVTGAYAVSPNGNTTDADADRLESDKWCPLGGLATIIAVILAGTLLTGMKLKD
jgi:hypothetical protein